MSLHEVGACFLLFLGVAGFALTSIGLLAAGNVYDQIHYLSGGSLIGLAAIPAAVLLHEGFSQAGVKAILIAILLIFSNPVLSHALARAAHIRRKEQAGGAGQEQNVPNESKE